MKRILWAGAFALVAGGQALAADLPPPPPAPRAPATYVPVAVPVYNWSGIYIGANGGYGFGTSNWSLTRLLSRFDRQLQHQWLARRRHRGRQLRVLGWRGARCRGRLGLDQPQWYKRCWPLHRHAPATGCQTSSNWLSTVRGRAGWAFDRVLLYGTGGVAFAPVQTTINGSGGGTTAIPKSVGRQALGLNSPLRRTGPPKPNISMWT